MVDPLDQCVNISCILWCDLEGDSDAVTWEGGGGEFLQSVVEVEVVGDEEEGFVGTVVEPRAGVFYLGEGEGSEEDVVVLE